MRFGLRAKFILLISLVLLVVIGVAAFVMLTQNVRSLRSGIRTDAKSFTSLATKPIGDSYVLYRDGGQIKVAQEIQHFTDLNTRISNVAIADIEGSIVFSSKDEIENISAAQASAFEPIYITAADGTLQRVIAPYLEDNGAHRYTLVYNISNADVVESIQRIVKLIVVLSLGGLLASALLTYMLVRQLFLDPLGRVRTSALAISEGHLDQQIVLSRHDEVGDLAKAVNTMANVLKADISGLKEADKIKSEFMMIASHNLRTPLTIMEGFLGFVEEAQISPEIAENVASIKKQLGLLQHFSEDMITISSFEVGQKIYRLENNDLTQLFAQTVNSYREQAEAKGISYSADIPTEPIMAQLSPRYLGMALGNVIDNAIKFTKEGSVSISLSKAGNLAEIKVRDTGIGVSLSERSKLFTKFHRGTSTLDYDYSGLGIGLYLSKLVINEHGGTIRYEPQPKGGSSFIIELPV